MKHTNFSKVQYTIQNDTPNEGCVHKERILAKTYSDLQEGLWRDVA